MALSKSITITYQTLNNAAGPSSVTSFTAQPMVQDGRLVPDPVTLYPGVKSPGQASEGTASNPPMDSNG